ncbi:MAG: VWA domain-containing protein [Thermoanaerobaculia bacterium]|nr:VWA domain-containing protein [Thermoanaerobaculia bacterium]
MAESQVAPHREAEVREEVSEAFFEQIAVDVVNVEVFVQDREGRPVTHLTRDDFLVFEDDRPVEVVNFYRVAGGRPDIDSLAAPQTVDTPLPEREIEPLIPESQRLHLVVYVDNYHLHALNRNRVFNRLRQFLQQTVSPGDEVMVATYDRSLHIRQPFTRDVQQVNRQLLELEKLTGFAAEREAERSRALARIYETQSHYEALWEAKQFAEHAHFGLQQALSGFEELLDSLAGLPGRKVLIHVSDGLPMVPGQDLYQAVQQRFADLSALGEAFSRDTSRTYMQLIAQANSSRIAIYTIDASGLQIHSGFGAEEPAVRSPFVVSTAVDAVRSSNLQDTLVMVADRTGGQSIINTNDVGDGLARFAVDLENYYSLGYRAPIENRGRYHRIEVRLKDRQRGWKIRHREGYRDKSVSLEMSEAAEAFLAHGYETNPLEVSFAIEEQRAGKGDTVDVSISVRVPIERLVLLPRPGFHEARLRIYFGAVDERGRKAPLRDLPFELRIPDDALERARRDSLVRVIDATMRPGPHKIVIGVRDEIGAVRSIVGRGLAVRPTPDGGSSPR